MKKLVLSIIFTLFSFTGIFASSFFTGYAGGKFEYTADAKTGDDDKTTYDPNLKLQAFFAGQFNFTSNLWGRMEFSIDTADFINQTLFSATESDFQVDEISLTVRSMGLSFANYFSTFMGTYDAIGSDIFLQRYFSIEKIASELTNSWLGLAGSILYPHFGIGICDILRFYSQPIAMGAYIYLNHEDESYYVVNADVRAACNYRFFTADFACGIGAPISDKYKGQDVLLAIESIYWHCGTTILVGNNYTQALFLQAGLFNAEFGASSNTLNSSPDDIYLLLEPRFTIKSSHLNITVYSLPSSTVKDLLYLDDTLGININIYSEALKMNGTPFKLGCHTTLSFSEKTFLNLAEFASFFVGDTKCFNVNIIPYFSTQFLSGELNALLKVECLDFVTGEWYEGISANLGYKCSF